MANSALQGSFISSDFCCWLFDFLAFESRDRFSSQFSLVTLPVSVWRSYTLEISDNWRPRKAFVVYIQKFEDDMIKLSVNKTKCTGLDLDSLDFDLNIWFRPEKLPVLQWCGHPRVLGIPIPKTLVIWVFSSHITFPIWVSDRVRVTGDAHITRVWEWGCPKRGNAHITVTPGLSSNGGALDNEPVFKIAAEDNKQGFRLFTVCIYSLLFANHWAGSWARLRNILSSLCKM